MTALSRWATGRLIAAVQESDTTRVRWLLRCRCADPCALIPDTDDQLIVYAAREGLTQVVEELVRDARVRRDVASLWTALHEALNCDDNEIAAVLMRHLPDEVQQ